MDSPQDEQLVESNISTSEQALNQTPQDVTSAVQEEFFDPTVELCKELTGMDYEDDPEEVLYTMMQDRKKVAETYGLPLIETYEDRRKFCNELVEIAAQNDVPIKYVKREELEKRGLRGGYTSQGKVVVSEIDLENASVVDLYNWAVEFEHELTHALQAFKDPKMSSEQQEYEAYILTYLPTECSLYKDYPKDYIQYYMIISDIFGHIKNSSLGYYEKVGIKPEDLSWMKKKKVVDAEAANK